MKRVTQTTHAIPHNPLQTRIPGRTAKLPLILVSPVGGKRGKKMRENPLPCALTSLPETQPDEPQVPESILAQLTPARRIVRAIRNKTTNVDLSYEERDAMLIGGIALNNAAIMAHRNSHAILHAFKPTPGVTYCTPSVPCEVGSPCRPYVTAYDRPLLRAVASAKQDMSATARQVLVAAIDKIVLNFAGIPSAHAHIMATGKALAYRNARNAVMASLIPPSDYHSSWGEAIIREQFAPNVPHRSIPAKNYVRRFNAVQQARQALQIPIWQADHPLGKYKQSALKKRTHKEPDYMSRENAPIREKTALGGSKETGLSFFEHDSTPGQMDDVESAKQDMLTTAQQVFNDVIRKTSPGEERSEDNFLVMSRNLSDGSVSLKTSPTMKSGEMQARMEHARHPNTVQTVLSKVQARACRLDILLADYASKHATT